VSDWLQALVPLWMAAMACLAALAAGLLLHWLLLTTLQADDQVRQPPFDAIIFELSGLWG